jgi:hypothetical protein
MTIFYRSFGGGSLPVRCRFAVEIKKETGPAGRKKARERKRFFKTIAPPDRRGFTFEPLNSIPQEFPYHFLIKTRELAKFINSNELILFFAKHFTDQLKEMLGSTNTTTGNVLYIPGINNDSLWYHFFQRHNTL